MRHCRRAAWKKATARIKSRDGVAKAAYHHQQPGRLVPLMYYNLAASLLDFVGQRFVTDSFWQGDTTPIIFLRPIGIAAGDAMRLLEAAKRLDGPVRWRMAPPGVLADAYLVHAHSIAAPDPDLSPINQGIQSDALMPSGSDPKLRKLKLDADGNHRGHPVGVVGRSVDTSLLDSDELAPLVFPDALLELKSALAHLLQELWGPRMLYLLGSLAWAQRQKWGTHRFHAVESGQLVAAIEPQHWRLHVRLDCTVEQMANADLVPVPTSGRFAAESFRGFALEAALWELAKRCPEPMLTQILPTAYLHSPLTHRRAPPMKDSALGDHCLAILRRLDTQSSTANELQVGLRLTEPAVLRALTCLAVVRAIQPESDRSNSLLSKVKSAWARWRGKRFDSLAPTIVGR